MNRAAVTLSTCALAFVAIAGARSSSGVLQPLSESVCGRVVTVSCEGPSSGVTLSLRSLDDRGINPRGRSSLWQIELPAQQRWRLGPRVEDRYERRVVCVPKAALSTTITRRPVLDPDVLTVKDVAGSALSLPDGVFRSCDAEVEPPKPIRTVKPLYTGGAMHAKVQGDVILVGVVDRNGAVGQVSVLESLEPGLDAEAEKALVQWRFQPARRHGEPIEMAVTVQMTFTLR